MDEPQPNGRVKKEKILLICNTDGALYVFRRPILRALLARGAEVFGICGASSYLERLYSEGVVVDVLERP